MIRIIRECIHVIMLYLNFIFLHKICYIVILILFEVFLPIGLGKPLFIFLSLAPDKNSSEFDVSFL